MLHESTADEEDPEAENVEVTARRLGRMFFELKELSVDDARVYFALSDFGPAIRQKLDLLSGIIELRRAARDTPGARILDQRARVLARHLESELESLAIQAEHDFEWIT